jgi:tetratricopeptide (TPR) repeat protein
MRTTKPYQSNYLHPQIFRFFVLFLSLLGMTQAIYPQSAQVQRAFKESMSLETQNKYSQAVATLKGVYDQNSYETNLRLGWLTYLAGQQTESLNYYQRAINLLPMSIEAKLGYTYPASKLEQWDSVLSQYLAILRIDPNHSFANYHTGLIYYYRKKYTDAERYFLKVQNLYPFDTSNMLMLGWTKYFLGKKSEAKVLFTKVLLGSPDNSSATQGLQAAN